MKYLQLLSEMRSKFKSLLRLSAEINRVLHQETSYKYSGCALNTSYGIVRLIDF